MSAFITGDNSSNKGWHMPEPKYPDITVKLTGIDGNAMVIISACTKVMRRAGVPKDEISAFVEEAMSSDYNNVLQTCMRWVEVE